MGASADGMAIMLTKVVQTCWGCPSQWDAWDASGTHYYLRYRFGSGSVEKQEGPYNEEGDHDPRWVPFKEPVKDFTTGSRWDGVISLVDFCERAGLELAPDCEIS